MAHTRSARQQILDTVTSWPGVETGTGSRGEYSIRLGRREIGHLHGEHVAHFGFPKSLWADLIEQGRVVRHPVDQPGWAARRIETDRDVREVIELLRLNYDRFSARSSPPKGDG
jgi:hypothetical protein